MAKSVPLTARSLFSSERTKVSSKPPRAGCPGARRASGVALSRLAARPESATKAFGVFTIFDVRFVDQAGTVTVRNTISR
jgi:hypothetical protein